jgi:hypothetical protein
MQGTKCPNITTTLKVIMLSNQLATCFSPPPPWSSQSPLVLPLERSLHALFSLNQKKVLYLNGASFRMQNGQKISSIEGKHLVGGESGPERSFWIQTKNPKRKKKAAGGWSALGEWVNFFFFFFFWGGLFIYITLFFPNFGI